MLPPMMYADRDLIGGVAAIDAPADVVAYAERQGLIAIGPSGDTAELLNSRGFRPRVR